MRRKAGEDVVLVAVGRVLGVGEEGPGAVNIPVRRPCIILIHRDDFARVVHRQGPQRDGVEQRKDGRIHADAEGQGEHGDQRKARGLAKQAKAVSKVLQEHGHAEFSLGDSTTAGAEMFRLF